MQQPDLVRGIQSLGDLLDGVHRLDGRQWPTVQDRLQVPALDQPHIHVQPTIDFPVGVNRHDVRTVQSRDRMGFATKPPLENLVAGNVGRQYLKRDDPVDDGVVGPPYFAHAAAAQQFDQLVATEQRFLQRGLPQAPFQHDNAPPTMVAGVSGRRSACLQGREVHASRAKPWNRLSFPERNPRRGHT